MVNDNKNFFGKTYRTLEKAIQGMEYFRAWDYTTQKSPPRNASFFVYQS